MPLVPLLPTLGARRARRRDGTGQLYPFQLRDHLRTMKLLEIYTRRKADRGTNKEGKLNRYSQQLQASTR